MHLLYITFIDFDKAVSGSSVRPQKMYAAFQEMGLTVKLLQGQQNIRRQRQRNVKEIMDWLDSNRPDFCYIEPPSGPFFNRIDLKLLRKLKQMKIPTGLFYRDMYWKFDVYQKTQGLVARLKNMLINIMHRRDWRVFKKTLSIIYFPTQTMAELLPGDYVRKALPPGCFNAVDKHEANVKKGELPVGLYIGGLLQLYGVSKMLEAAQLINAHGTRFKLKLICRKPEWENFRKENRIEVLPDWLEVLHISGDELLKKQYVAADFALCPHEVNAYNNVTISVKLMEYLSYLKPVVVTETMPMKSFVERYNIGIVTEDSVGSYAQGMLRMIEDSNLREEFVRNCIIAREQNLWVCRAQKVVEDLKAIQELNH